MVSEFEFAGHASSKIEQKLALLQGLPAVFYVTAETILAAQYEFHEAVSKLIARKFRIKPHKDNPEAAVFMRNEKKRFKCGNHGHIAKNCWKNKSNQSSGEDMEGIRDNCICYKC